MNPGPGSAPADAGAFSSADPDFVDRALSVVSGLGLLFIAAMLFWGGRGPPVPASTASIAKVASAVSNVRRRPAGTLLWEDIRTGDSLRQGDSLFVAAGASARIAFVEGSTVEVDENSLVVLETPQAGVAAGPNTVSLVKGTLSGTAGAEGVDIRGAQGTARLGSGAEARVTVAGDHRAKVEVHSGMVKLDTPSASTLVQANEAAAVSDDQVTRAPVLPVRLDSPTRDKRIFFLGTPQPVDLRWSGAGADRVLVASDREFKDVLATGPGSATRFVFLPDKPGIYWWQVVGPSGETLSESRKIVVIKDVPPVAVSPTPQEIVYAPPGTAVPFAWSPIPGVSRYRLEASSDPQFLNGVIREEAEAPGLWLKRDLAEGTYSWRVRSLDAERGDSPFSKPVTFRLIVKPLPEAPQLLDSEIEVERPPEPR